MIQTAKQHVFAILEVLGDQSSIKELQDRINNSKFSDCCTDAITKKQEELIRKTGLTSESFWELYHDHPELLEIKWGNIVRLIDKLVEKYGKAADGITYQQAYSLRSEWRKQKEIERDCRTYVGQPDRNMIRKAV
jgi:hypothetical protein